MGDHRLTAGPGDPLDRLAQRRPLAGHVAGPPAHQVPAEDVTDRLGATQLDEHAGEVGPTDQPAVRQRPRPLEGIGDSVLRQPPTDLLRAPVAETAQSREAVLQRGVLGIDAEPDDVHRHGAPGADISTPGTNRSPSPSAAWPASATPSVVS